MLAHPAQRRPQGQAHVALDMAAAGFQTLPSDRDKPSLGRHTPPVAALGMNYSAAAARAASPATSAPGSYEAVAATAAGGGYSSTTGAVLGTPVSFSPLEGPPQQPLPQSVRPHLLQEGMAVVASHSTCPSPPLPMNRMAVPQQPVTASSSSMPQQHSPPALPSTADRTGHRWGPM